ncbi:MAG: hypothetical protein QXP20_07140 [Candidatus Bathyarchaeia archaeon]
MKLYLCGKSGCCPAVELEDDKVRIGEEGNQVTLSKEEWNTLVAKIKSNELKAL